MAEPSNQAELGKLFILQLLEGFNTVVAKQCSESLRTDNINLLPKISPLDYATPYDYLKDAQAIALLKKNPWAYTSAVNADANALRKFLESEDQCREVNHILRRRELSFPARSLLEEARNFIHRILGEVNLSFPDSDFGPGSSFKMKGQSSSIVRKLEGIPECTSACHDLVYFHILDQLPHYAISCGLVTRSKYSVNLSTRHLPVVGGNRLCFVPKTADCSRAICVEPLGNLLLQKSLGSQIRKALRRFGLDINDNHLGNAAQALHKEVARRSSIDGINATIDLSSASDSISYELVRFLLPDAWFDVLNQLRSPKTRLPSGDWVYNEKFSSMGNGFTFELETLIFYALALSVRRTYGTPSDTVLVYGDDIIISRDYAEKLIDLLETIGFKTNSDKTFLSGPFRESCGGDYFNGHDVRPIFLKGDPNEETFFIYLTNFIRKLSSVLTDGLCCDYSYYSLWKNCIRYVPTKLRTFGPSRFEHTIHVSYGEYILRGNTRSACRTIATKRQRIRCRTVDGINTMALYGIRSGGVSFRGAKTKYRRVTVEVFLEDFGTQAWSKNDHGT